MENKNYGAFCFYCGCIRITGFNRNGAVCPDCGRKHHYVSGGYIPEGWCLKLERMEEVSVDEGSASVGEGQDVPADRNA